MEETFNINTTNINYWKWGKNCNIIKLTEDEANICISNLEVKITSEQRYFFWEGYYSPNQ